MEKKDFFQLRHEILEGTPDSFFFFLFIFFFYLFFFFRKLSAPKKVSGGETVSSGSEPEKQRNQKRILPLGTAETKKLAKKGKGQQKTRKRKAEGLNGIVHPALLLPYLRRVC